MKVSTILILIVIIAAGVWYANKEGYFKKAGEQVDTPAAHYAKGFKLYTDMKYDDAIAAFKTAIEKNAPFKDKPMCMRRLGDCYKEKKMYKEAIATYEKLIEEFPDDKITANTKNAIEEVQAIGHF